MVSIAKAVNARAAGIKDDTDTGEPANAGQCLGNLKTKLRALNHTRPGNDKQRVIQTDGDAADLKGFCHGTFLFIN